MKNLFCSNSQLVKLLWLILLVAGFGGTAFGATFTVTKTADTGDNVCDADCSLREAIVAAGSTAVGDDVIEFDAGVFATAQTVTLATELFVFGSGTLTINGTGANLLTISGNNVTRVFYINTGTNITINGVKITGGNQTASPGVGGGIYNNGGMLAVNNCTISNNTASFGGGGIYSNGSLTVSNSTITNNTGNFEGGGVLNNGTANFINSTLSGNSSSSGGGVRSSNTLSLSGSSVNNNLLGGGIHISGGTLSINNTSINGNQGGIRNFGGTLTTIDNSIISNNSSSSSGAGGGIVGGGTMTISNSIIIGNSSPSGSGIYCGGTVNLNNVSVIGNTSSGVGGGIYVDTGALTINNSTFTGNTALHGGAIYSSIATISLNNTTISGNATIGTGGRGGGANFSGTVNLTNVTVSNNSSGFGGGISGTVNARNTIIADNSATGNYPDLFGTLNSQGYNLLENTFGANVTGTTTGNILGQDPQLAPLRNNGGATQTVALQAGSPAIDAADPTNFSATDQRGIARPQDGDLNGSALPDIGAYERQATAFTVTKTADSNDGACNRYSDKVKK